MEVHALLCYTFSVIFLTNLLFIDQAGAGTYIVGDDEGWTTSENYVPWAETYNFTVGDVLVFNYVKGQHDTCVVTEDTYRSCNTSTGILEKYNGGHDEVKLTEVKKYWFLCSIEGHCLDGMKFGIEVKQQIANFAPPAERDSADDLHWRLSWTCYLVAFGFWLFMA